MSLSDAVKAAVTPTPDATPAPAPETGAPAAEAPKGTEPATTDQQPPLFFHRKDKAKETLDLDTLDSSKLAPELLPIYKSMQADYTKKRQADADFRKQMEAEKAALVEQRKVLDDFLTKVAQGKTDAQAADPARTDPMEEIKALRENGEHAEADRKLQELWSQQQEAALRPVRLEAEQEKAKATFREVTMAATQNDKMIETYRDYVAQQFDRTDDPELNAMKNDILSSPVTMKRYVPMYLRFFAQEAHIKNLEHALETRVDTLVQERIKAERLKAAGVPAKLVSSGATSREGGPQRMNLSEAYAAATEKLSGH